MVNQTISSPCIDLLVVYQILSNLCIDPQWSIRPSVVMYQTPTIVVYQTLTIVVYQTSVNAILIWKVPGSFTVMHGSHQIYEF